MNNFKKLYSNTYRCETTPNNSTELNSFSKKEEFLFSHKSSLETLLSIIKNVQITFLSNISKNNKNYNNKKLKEIIIELRENLLTMYNQQKAKSSFLESQSTKKKIFIQNKIFEISKKNEIFQNLKTELEQLRILNFKAENDIKLIQNLAMKNFSINEYLKKNISKYYEEKEINCLKPKFHSIITRILNGENIETKNYFKYVVSRKQHQDDQIRFLLKRIEQLKSFIYNKQNGYNNYIFAEDIIPEDSKEYSQSMNINNINKTLNKIIMNKNRNNILNIENDEFSSENSSLSIKKNNEGKNLNKFINLNMNINLNFNFDKKYTITDDNKYNSDRVIKNKDKNCLRLKQKKGFSSTDNLPYLIMNFIKEETKSQGNNNEKEEIFNHKNKTTISNDILPEEYLVTI